LRRNKGATIVGSLGTISKDLQELDDGRNCILPVKGAMGCAMAVGLGIAISSREKVIVLVGEGSFLMKLGTIATINRYRQKNLKIIIIKNNKYESCGGQENNCGDIFSNELSHLDSRTYQVFEVA